MRSRPQGTNRSLKESLDLSEHPRFKSDLFEGERNLLQDELFELRRHDPSALDREGCTDLARVHRLQALNWSIKSIRSVTGWTRQQQRSCRDRAPPLGVTSSKPFARETIATFIPNPPQLPITLDDRQNVNLRDHPCFKAGLSLTGCNVLRRELLALQQCDPNALRRYGRTELARVHKLQKIEWSSNSIEQITGWNRKQQEEWRHRALPATEALLEMHGLRARLPFDPPKFPLLDTKIPNELLDMIYGHLALKDILALRQTSKSMASSVGVKYLGSTVALISRRDKFRALVEIAKHPQFSKQVRSLYYICDRLNLDVCEFEKAWRNRRIIPQRPSYELESLDALFLGCRRLREVTVASKDGCLGQPNAFGKAVAGKDSSNMSFDWRHTGVRQILNLANAVAYSGLKLDSLTISETTHRLWDNHSENEKANLEALVRPLRRLRIFVKARRTPSHDGNDRSGFETDYDTRNYRTGRFRAMLTEATNLRVLKLQFPPFQPYCRSYRSPNLEDLLGDLQFPRLYELAISRCAADSSYLRDVILRHKSTLRRLTISRIHLVSNDFEAFVESIAGQLPDLCEVTLRGVSTPEPWSPRYCNGTYPTAEYPEKTMGRYHAERFVLLGGVAPNWTDWWNEGMENYVQPRRLRKERLPDDPKWDYDWDEFDDRILPPPKQYAW